MEVRKLGLLGNFPPPNTCYVTWPQVFRMISDFTLMALLSCQTPLGWRYQHHSHHYAPTRPSLICNVNEPGHLELASSQTQAPLLWIVLCGASLQACVSVTVGSHAGSVRLALHIKQCQQVPACNWIIRSCWEGGVDQTDLAGLVWRTEEGWAWERIFVLFLS